MPAASELANEDHESDEIQAENRLRSRLLLCTCGVSPWQPRFLGKAGRHGEQPVQTEQSTAPDHGNCVELGSDCPDFV